MIINWNNIRTLQNSQNEGFEELVCQLARSEKPEKAARFIRKGKPDAGVECFWILEDGTEWAWQAKYFTSSLTNTQWGEIDDSVKTVLEKHPNLKVYYIAIPVDPPDARIDNQKSMLQKWDEHVEKWRGWASDKGMDVEIRPWWNSDLIDRLRRPENAGLTYFWFNKEEFTDEWCLRQTQLSISELGRRYTPELNIDLPISRIFDGIARDGKFKLQIEELFKDFIDKGTNLLSMPTDSEKPTDKLNQNFEGINRLFCGIEFTGLQPIPLEDLNSLLKAVTELIDEISEFYWNKESELGRNAFYEKYGARINKLREFEYSAAALQDFIQSTTAKLSNHPILMLDGEAGIGKSHLLADVIANRNKDGQISIFLLGQHFVTDEDPWTQIFKQLKIRCSVEEFLGALNAKAEAPGSRLIIFIDAINEGRGKYFWDKNIKSFIKQILKYKWLGLVLSVRSSYLDLIIPEDDRTEDLLLEHTHYGFRDIEYESTKLFFENYGIELPSVPMLHPEFQNPLFLKLFCEGLYKAGLTRIPGGFQGISSIIEFYIASVNSRLARPDRFEYPSNINLAKRAVETIILAKIEKDSRYVPYEEAFVLVDRLLSDFSTKKGFLDELISEGLISKNFFWKSDREHEEGVYLAYERFDDHLTATVLIERNCDEIEAAFLPEGNLFRFVKDTNAVYINKGLVEALAIQLPEKTGREIYEYVLGVKDEYPVVESFVQSLLWRKTDTVTERLLPYINESVFDYQGTYDLFWDTVISAAAVPDHYFNGRWLNEYLMRFSLADRDAEWTQYLKDQIEDDSAVKRLIDWGWSTKDKNHIADDSILLSAIALVWLHTSTNRRLRDAATKALICLLENRISVLISLLRNFEQVNDPYVYERLFAVAYGCAVRTNQKDALPELSEYIFHTIFENKEEVYPHILLRDYARGVIEFTAHLQYRLSFEVQNCRPPYRSTFSYQALSNDELDSRYKYDYKSKDFKDFYWAQNEILNSMTTEYGRGVARYGDFGRYTFQSALYDWDVNPDEMSNIAVEWIFERYGYDVEKHGEFDRSIGAGRGRRNQEQERIGKKYQWIAFFELLARVSDNFPKYNRWSASDDKQEQYAGPWSPYVRDIDPTMIISRTERVNYDNPNPFWWAKIPELNWDMPNKEWLSTSEDLPSFQSNIEVADNSGEKWLVLEGFPSYREVTKVEKGRLKKPYKNFWYHIRSYLVKKEDYESLARFASSGASAIRRLPQSHDRYEIFSREYYWSPAHRYFYTAEHDGDFWQSIEGADEENVSSVMVTTESLLWEEQNDYSKEEVISFLKPSTYLYQKLNMSYGKGEGAFTDNLGNVICFDPSVYNRSNSYLLIKKELLNNFLEENDFRILWTIIGEKNIINDHPPDDDLRWLEINGVLYLENGEIEGNISAINT